MTRSSSDPPRRSVSTRWPRNASTATSRSAGLPPMHLDPVVVTLAVHRRAHQPKLRRAIVGHDVEVATTVPERGRRSTRSRAVEARRPRRGVDVGGPQQPAPRRCRELFEAITMSSPERVRRASGGTARRSLRRPACPRRPAGRCGAASPGMAGTPRRGRCRAGSRVGAPGAAVVGPWDQIGKVGPGGQIADPQLVRPRRRRCRRSRPAGCVWADLANPEGKVRRTRRELVEIKQDLGGASAESTSEAELRVLLPVDGPGEVRPVAMPPTDRRVSGRQTLGHLLEEGVAEGRAVRRAAS